VIGRSCRALLVSGAALVLVVSPARADVEVEARVSRSTLSVGETSTIDVIVRGAATGVHEPEFDVPSGLALLGTNRTQSFSAINGRVTLEVVYRFEIAANAPGAYRVGPVYVRVGNQTYESPGANLRVMPSREQVTGAGGGAGAGPASLVVDVVPTDPYVGQPVVMRVRLIQRATLAEDPSYTPPATPGFWSERASQPESYYAEQGGSRVLVTETRTRLYPLAAGVSTIGEAAATVVIATPGAGIDPLQWLGGRVPRREVTMRSHPVPIRIRPLPSGTPAAFVGAVGTLAPSWNVDRQRTSLDVPVTVRLELRGIGNLPLVRTPPLESSEVEQFASTVEDSLASAGTIGVGLRRFQWTILPRHQGRVEIPPPAFAWFDPRDGRYHEMSRSPVTLEVGPPQSLGSGADESFPSVFARAPLDPFHRGAEPWGYAVAGLMLGVAVRFLRSASRPLPDQVERARQREWLQAVDRSTGPEFWSAADRACEWLESHDLPVAALRRQIEASRYGGARADADVVRRELRAKLAAVLPPPAPRWILRAGGVAMALAALSITILLGPRGGPDRAVARARAADRAARQGEIDRARSEWTALWREGARSPALAARLAWAELRAGAVGTASLWALRGDREEPRDRAMEWVTGKIRETGGLVGFTPARLPVRRIEWALLALIAGTVAAIAWPQRWPSTAAFTALLAASAVYPVQGWMADRAHRGVVTSEVRFEGSAIELEPGQVIRVLARDGDRALAAAGKGISGWIPASALAELEAG
jgi:hypothetical protein